MGWKIVKRRLGQAGGFKERLARQAQWDARYGEESWCIGYKIEGVFVPQEEALEAVYEASYDAFFEAHPNVLQELITLAKNLRNPHAVATTSVDLQVPAIRAILKRRGLSLQGTEVVDIGTWRGERSHGISERLSPLHIPCVQEPRLTLEKYWQTRKCLAIWSEP